MFGGVLNAVKREREHARARKSAGMVRGVGDPVTAIVAKCSGWKSCWRWLRHWTGWVGGLGGRSGPQTYWWLRTTSGNSSSMTRVMTLRQRREHASTLCLSTEVSRLFRPIATLPAIRATDCEDDRWMEERGRGGRERARGREDRRGGGGRACRGRTEASQNIEMELNLARSQMFRWWCGGRMGGRSVGWLTVVSSFGR